MRDTVPVDWYTPKYTWQTIEKNVIDEKGSKDGYLGREAERAMREYIDTDGFAGVEGLVDRLVAAVGRRPEDMRGEKNTPPSGTPLEDQPTERVSVRVDRELKEQFKAVADENGDQYGIAFGKALRERLDGGRAGRLERKLGRIVDDVEAVLAEVNDTTDDGLDDGDRKLIAITDRLDEQFTDDELDAAIHDIVGRGPEASPPTLRKWRDIVIDHLDVEPHPHNDDIWVPPSTAADYAPDGTPRECRRPVELLEDDERARRVVLEAGVAATTNSDGEKTIGQVTVERNYLDGEVDSETAREYMQAAANDHPGFYFDTSGQRPLLKVDLKQTNALPSDGGDPDLYATIRAYEQGDPLPTGQQGQRSVDDYTDDGGDAMDDVRAEEQRLFEAAEREVATDGGRDVSETTEAEDT